MTHKNEGFIENLMKVPAPLYQFFYTYFNSLFDIKSWSLVLMCFLIGYQIDNFIL